MTDYSELITRVRSPFALTERDAQEIAATLEAQAKEIAEKDARIAELEAALKPFAYYAEQIPDDVSDTASASGTVGDLRNARAALKGDQNV